ncbi:MAG: transposase [Myxococcota bacterium]
MPEYERHEPEKTLLHQVVREELESFLARACEVGSPVARFVEREIRAYLDCGVLANGFLRVHCDDCGHDRLVAFSCKGRGFCPSCGGRRMADTAAHLVERVLPEVPVRQWVLTLPYPLRWPCAWDAKLTSAVLRAFLRALFVDQRRRAKQVHGVRRGHCAAVTFIQRFGSALNLTPHFHSLVLDGVYAGPAHSPGPFLPLPPPETEDVARVMAGTARRVRRLVESRGQRDDLDDEVAQDAPLLATLMAASSQSRIATGPEAGQRWRRLGDRVEPTHEYATEEPPPRCVREGGMSLHADVAVPARDRKRLERLCRYVARPPIAIDRLEALPDGRLAYRLKSRWRDGTTHVLMERRELLERLAPLIPPPRAHQVRYHGLLAPCASGRGRVVPRPVVSSEVGTVEPAALGGGRAAPLEESNRKDCSNKPPPISAESSQRSVDGESSMTLDLRTDRGTTNADGAEAEPGRGDACSKVPTRRTLWADLLQRVFEVDALSCPRCGGRMRVLAAITEPDVARRILACLNLPTRAPPLARSRPDGRTRGWPEHEVPGAAETHTPWSAFDFDQSPPAEWDVGG